MRFLVLQAALFVGIRALDSLDFLDINVDFDFDPAISNGTCFGSLENTLDENFLPCGNNALGVQSCCWQGDYCLVGAACFGIHDNSYVTYLAGCTDASYRHPRCPSKGTNDAWVGLQYCRDDSNNWEACEQPGHPTTLAAAGPCSCPSATASRTIGEFGVGSTISATASLPSTAGGTLSWVSPFGPVTMVTAVSMPGMTEVGTLTTTVVWRTTTSVSGDDPVTSSSDDSTSTLTSTSSVMVLSTWTLSLSMTGEPVSTTSPLASSTDVASISSVPTSTVSTIASASSPSLSSSPHKSLILGTSVGIGTALLVLLVLVAVFLMHRKRTKQGETVSEVPDDAESASKTTPSAVVQPAQTMSHDTSPISPASELETRPARPWSLRSELEDHNGCASQSQNMTAAAAATPTWKMISELEG